MPTSKRRADGGCIATGEVIDTGTAGYIFKKLIGVTFQQRNVPFKADAKAVSLLPGIRQKGKEHGEINTGIGRESSKPGDLVLNRVGGDDGETDHADKSRTDSGNSGRQVK